MGAGVVVTGQQVGLFGGPLYSPFKAATAIARARHATASGRAHAAIFWLASEDHDFAEVNNVTFPTGKELARLEYASAPESAIPAGSVILDDSIRPLVDRAAEILGPSDATEALIAAYRPGQTFAQAFADFYSMMFASQGLLIVDASGRDFHRLGASVLRAGIERADEFHAALVERNQALEAAGYHAQVAVAPESSLLFLIDDKTGARVALKRIEPTAAEPGGLWKAESADAFDSGACSNSGGRAGTDFACGAAAAGVSGFICSRRRRRSQGLRRSPTWRSPRFSSSAFLGTKRLPRRASLRR